MSTESQDSAPLDSSDPSNDPTREGLDTQAETLDAAQADLSEHRLRLALRELRSRSEDVVEDARALALPARVAGAALLAGLGAVAIASVVRRSRRRRRPRSFARAVGRSVVGEIAFRMALGAAGVIGARLASDLLLPALMPALLPAPAPTKRKRSSKVQIED